MVRGVKRTPYIIGNLFYPIQTYSKKVKIPVNVENIYIIIRWTKKICNKYGTFATKT